MESLLLTAIESEAKKRLAKYSRDWYYTHKYRKTFTKRTGKKAKGGASVTPNSWSHHPHFDPRYCINHAKFLAKGIWAALQAGTYKPIASLRVEIPKATGGFRTIDSFSVPDAAVAKIFLNNLRQRNAKIFSDSSYAYQVNKTPLDAVIKLKSAISLDIAFISQYDFSSYFDSIDHKYLDSILFEKGSFLTTEMERSLLRSVLTHDFKSVSGQLGSRDCGTAQGNSLSLFIANVAAHPLDDELGRLNGTFARFADDSVVVNTSYEDALRTAEAFHRFARKSGVKINALKSSGIRMFSDSPMEMAHISEFEFLGYRFTKGGLFVGERAQRNIKRRCSTIIYNNLLLHMRRAKSLNEKRIGKKFKDWDLVTCINELRSYIYGGLSQSSIDRTLSSKATIKNISGAVSYFALVEDGSVFRELDGWLANVLQRAYKARIDIAANLPKKRAITPLTSEQLIDGGWYKFSGISMETKLPSFFSAWRAARKSWSRHGLGGIDPQGMGYAYP
ncbi:reverse transcriptase domain-containing protein [Novosphingobium sp. fls2-241-R2A-195]|uniref:reverse transcriptase domain-containing protein n=1 Tax=Novosphingobium sp. fls2-241-R2A-195 TaxID=3040296 RepID=UPI00254ACEDB|nr:reverse transcriptase domain-containing protein [Novosphingobium sp. fls2-241-R2A-195]